MPNHAFVDVESDVEGGDSGFSHQGSGGGSSRRLHQSLLPRPAGSTRSPEPMGVMSMVHATSPRFSTQRSVLMVVVWATVMVFAVILVLAVRPSSSPDTDTSATPHPFIVGPVVPALVELPSSAKKAGNGRKGAGTELEVSPSLSLYHTATAIANGSLSHPSHPASTPAPTPASASAASSAPAESAGHTAGDAKAKAGTTSVHRGFSDSLAERASLTAATDPQSSPHARAHTRERGQEVSLSAQRAASAAVAARYRETLCSWWAGNRAAALSLIQQALGDVVNLVLSLNFQFTADRAGYVDQLEHWRAARAKRAESPARIAAGHDCRSVCAPVPPVSTSGSASAPAAASSSAAVSATNAFRQKLIECIICETAQIELSGRCDVKDAGIDAPSDPLDASDTPLDTSSPVPSDPEALAAAFDGILGDKAVRGVAGFHGAARGPFFLAAPLERTFETFFSLFSTFAYSPPHLKSFFPLPSRKVEVSVPRTRAHTRWLAELQQKTLLPAAHAALGLPPPPLDGATSSSSSSSNSGDVIGVETATLGSAGLGGGLGLQLLCRPSPDSAPVVLLSAGGGGGRGYSLAAATAEDKARRRRKRLSHETVAAAGGGDAAGANGSAGAGGRGTLESLPFRATRRAQFSSGGGGGLQVSAFPFGPPSSSGGTHTSTKGASKGKGQGKGKGSDKGVVKDALGRDATWLTMHHSTSARRNGYTAASHGGHGSHEDVDGEGDSEGEVDAFDVIAGGGGGGSVTITDDTYTEAHGSQHDADMHLPFTLTHTPPTPPPQTEAEAEARGVDDMRLNLYSALRDCLLHGPDAELVVAGGGGAGTGAQLTALARPLTRVSSSNRRGAASATAPPVSEQPLASAFFSAELGFSFLLPIPHAWFSPSPLPAVRARSALHSTEAGAGAGGHSKEAGDPQAGRAEELAAALAADAAARVYSSGAGSSSGAGAGAGAGGSHGRNAAPNPTLGALKRLELTRFTPLGEDPYALSAVAAVCVASCVAGTAADTAPAAATTTSDSAHGSSSSSSSGSSGRSRGLGGNQFPELLSTSTANTTPLFYAHCVCPCLQRHLTTRPWAGYLACRDQAVGTLDRATAGHVASAVDDDDERAARAVAEVVAAVQGAAAGQGGAGGRAAERIRNSAWGDGDAQERAWAPIQAAEGEHAPPVARNRHG